MEDKNLDLIMQYFGLENIEDAKKVDWILTELKNYGSWGCKVASYFSAFLSGTEGTRSFISPEKVAAFKSLFEGCHIAEDTN